ncbi:MAG: alpha-amylase family glycosyl hydrolase [Thermoanaerobaculia bacterium]
MRLLLSRGTRRALQIEGPASPSQSGSATLSESFREARELADKLAPLLPGDSPASSAGDLYGLSRLERALQAYLERFLAERDADILARALKELDRRFGTDVVDRLLGDFEDEFLPDRSDPIVADATSPGEEAPPIPFARREELLAGLLILSIAHANPARARLRHLFHFGGLVADPDFEPVIEALEQILARSPGLYDDDDNLLNGLRRPIMAAPASIAGQLRWLIDHWTDLLPEIEPELLAALDLIAEEEKPRFPPGPGPAAPPQLGRLEEAEVHYGADRSWMSSLVLAAKNAHVWLDQLSRSHGREITRLDQIPDSELEMLADRGFTGLWLIGLWERSRASRTIKQLCGNPDAVGSAYSLLAYRIAEDLGGDRALADLNERARSFGIRLSADMVPNHTGIDSDWMIERPDYFLSVPECPFPGYSFRGPDLSPDPRVGIFLEDHYYDRSDAAVVFKRVNKLTGDVRYVYHGNDGTSTPWNDTAQLDYLNPQTREAVARTILDVARKFPVIRFDAAMALARRHIRRLWHPEPGQGGAIPSRTEHALGAAKFDSAMPREFWREVVDRAETETPDTLLLAEAFWLMEGYFVRNLGLHRVYNSAFMNMLRNGDNRGYRKLVRESLEFDPEILRRYVNFLSNPDEETAIEQFGDGDRYFGACVLLATMPGLPMFAHGQIDGFQEKYGMEYRRAYMEESPNEGLVTRHEHQIFPLLRDRRRFAGVYGFAMHDFVGRAGTVDEDVLAFSHRRDRETSVVVFNNQLETVRGVLRLERPLSEAAGGGDTLAFRDSLSNRNFLRAASTIRDLGLELELAGYESLVLRDFRELEDAQGLHRRLRERIGLAGVADFEAALREEELEEARHAFGEVLATLSVAGDMSTPTLSALEEQLEELDRQFELITEESDDGRAEDSLDRGLDAWLEAISRLPAAEQALDWPSTDRMRQAFDRLLGGVENQPEARFVLSAFALLGYLGRRWGSSAVSELEPHRPARRVLEARGVPAGEAAHGIAWIELAAKESWLERTPPPGRPEAGRWLAGLRETPSAVGLLGYDPAQDRVSRTRLGDFLGWRTTAASLSWLAAGTANEDSGRRAEAVVGWCDVLERLRAALEAADLRIEPVLDRLGENRL